MARKGSRKVTPLMIADSCALLRSVSETITVLSRWHPGSIPIAIIWQQLAVLEQDFQALDVAIPAEPEPAGMFQEKA